MRRLVGAGLVCVVVAVVVFAVVSALRPSVLPRGDAHVDGPLLVSADPGLSSDGMAAIVEGEVSHQDGCLRLDSFAAVWPYGTGWDDAAEAVVLPNGDRATVGATVIGGGGYIDVRSFRSGLRPYGVYGEEGEQILADCVGPTGEVAFFNAGSEVRLVE